MKRLTETDANFCIRQIFGDGFITMTIRHGGGRLRAILFRAANGVAYPIASAWNWEDAIAVGREKLTVTTAN